MSAALARLKGDQVAAVLVLTLLSAPVALAQEVTAPSAPSLPATPAGLQVPADLPSLRATSPADPFEPFNRSVFGFNDFIDRTTIKPLAEGYRRWVPELARTGVENFFGNFSDVWSAVNQLLQGKVVQSAQMTLRVATNTIFGLGGLLDPATEFGLERQSEDLGQTLGTWGLPPGPYLVLPVFGPSTLRDATALPVDRVATSSSQFIDGGTGATVGLTSLNLVNTRAGLLGASKLLDEVAMDRYSFLRDAYLARRRNQVYDGNPPEVPDDDPDAPPAK